jgi:hypothetical protein
MNTTMYKAMRLLTACAALGTAACTADLEAAGEDELLGESTAALSQDAVPLRLYWNSGLQDNFSAATLASWETAAREGYAFARVEAFILPTQQTNTMPLKLYWHSGRGDYVSTATAQGQADAQNAGYTFVRVEGYVYASQPAGTVPLKLYWHSGRGDYVSTATVQGEADAQNAGYTFVRVEGYVQPYTTSTTDCGSPVLEYKFTNGYDRIYWDRGSGADKDVSVWRPITPDGYVSLGDFATSGYHYPTTSSPVVRYNACLMTAPIGYMKVWDDSGSGGQENGSFWSPIPPTGFYCLGDVAARGHHTPPPLDAVYCVRNSLTRLSWDAWKVWTDHGSGADDDVALWTPSPIGTDNFDLRRFFAGNNYSTPTSYLFGLSTDTLVYKGHAREVTFLATSDVHFGRDVFDGHCYDGESANMRTIHNMNHITETGAHTPRGVIIAGDLTGGDEARESDERDYYGRLGSDLVCLSMICNYKVCTELEKQMRYAGFVHGYGWPGKIDYDVYEGYGNHDGNLVRDAISNKNPSRPGILHYTPASEGAHYSWDWDDLHLVQLNRFPGDNALHTAQLPNVEKYLPENSLTFLRKDLDTYAGKTGRPLVLIHHYGFDCFSQGEDPCGGDDEAYWNETERGAYWNVINGKNVKAFITGHLHNSMVDYNFHGIPAVRAAEPKKGQFMVIHANDDELRVKWMGINRQDTVVQLTAPQPIVWRGKLTSGLSSNKCADVSGANTAYHTKIQLWDCNGTNAQQWTLTGSGELRSAVAPNRCLDVSQGHTASGTPVQLYSCNGTPAQRWILAANGEVRSALTPDRCLDVQGANTSNGTQLQIYTCNGTLAQKWTQAP